MDVTPGGTVKVLLLVKVWVPLWAQAPGEFKRKLVRNIKKQRGCTMYSERVKCLSMVLKCIKRGVMDRIN